MPQVNYINADGTARCVDVSVGTSVMRGAKEHDIDGIDADCGGVCACATCHVFVDEAWFEKVGPAGADEEEMLDCVVDRGPTSRLSCQIDLNDELDGLVVRLPATQR